MLFPVVVAGLGAAAQGNLSSRMEASIEALADPDVRKWAAGALGEIGPAAEPAVPALIEALADADPDVRRRAASALGEIGPAAVPVLIELLADAHPNVRREAASALWRIGPAAEPAVPALAEALADADPEVKARAAEALGRIGLAAGPAVPALIEALADPAVQLEAAVALRSIGLAAVPALIEALADAHPDVRRRAAWALEEIGPPAAVAVPALLEALADADPDVRHGAARALGTIGPAAAAAVPALVEALADGDPEVRREAASILREIGPAAAAAVPALVEALADADPEVRRGAASALGRIGPAAAAAVPALVEVLADRDLEVRRGAALALGNIGPAAAAAVPALVGALAGADVQEAVAWALEEIGPAGEAAVPTLMEALAAEHPEVRRGAASALGKIGPAAAAAVPALVGALAGADVQEAVAWALEEIGPAGEAAVPTLIEALAAEHPEVRRGAASALGEIGPSGEPAVPALVEALADAYPEVRQGAASAVAKIATFLGDAGATGALGALRDARAALETQPSSDLVFREALASVSRAVTYLELQRWERLRQDLVVWIRSHPLAAFIIGVIPVWVSLYVAIFWFNPAAILKINNVLSRFDFKLPEMFGGMSVSLRYLLLVGVLNHRPRVLDAWVSRYVGKARENFERKLTVEERSVHIPVPVHLDKETLPELKGPHLRGVFGAGTGRLLIWGEGGSGKTSTACRIARWAMADAPEQLPASHRMLPVLIERELDFEVGEEKDPFTETVRGDLETLIEARVGDDLLCALLERRRVLVIIDHLSEMTEATRRRVRPDMPGFPAAALIVTSRLEERLGDVPKSSLRPLRVTGEYLSEFMGAYLKARGVREMFPDREFFQAGARISELVGERDITVLLVKLYLDRLIELKHRGGDLEKEMPESIPTLMLQYLNDVNGAVPDGVRRDEREVHRDAEAVAWACLEERFRPGQASIDRSVIPKLAAVEAANKTERLDYLERRLRLVETVEPERDRVRFALDPVAEYLAGLHLVGENRQDERAWRALLERIDASEGGLEAIRGFVLALRDCCLYRPGEVPGFLADELAERGGLDLGKVMEARTLELVARYARQLRAPDVRDRQVAAAALGKFGPEAATALPALIDALQDDRLGIRMEVLDALDRMGPAAAPAIPAVIMALEDESSAVRNMAVLALSSVGPAAPAVAALIMALQDECSDVRFSAALSLDRLGPAAAVAVPALISALNDENGVVRASAVKALRSIDPAISVAAVQPPQVKALKDGRADRKPSKRLPALE